MHDAIFQLALAWHVVLIGALAVYASRQRDVMGLALALDTVPPVFVAAIALIAIHRAEPGYLHVALVVALLGFAQTVAAVRYARARGRERND